MSEAEVEQVVRSAFPDARVVSVDRMPDSENVMDTEFFSGLLVAGEFESVSPTERFWEFQHRIYPYLPSEGRPEVKLSLFSPSEYNRLTGLVA